MFMYSSIEISFNEKGVYVNDTIVADYGFIKLQNFPKVS